VSESSPFDLMTLTWTIYGLKFPDKFFRQISELDTSLSDIDQELLEVFYGSLIHTEQEEIDKATAIAIRSTITYYNRDKN
jgi:aspartyl/asparaginyl beta-hydroxylase (cupin superfamily)